MVRHDEARPAPLRTLERRWKLQVALPLGAPSFIFFPSHFIIWRSFSTVQEELLGEGCEFLREALASIPSEEKRQLQKASQAVFTTPVASPLGSAHGLQIPSPTRSVSASDTTSADVMRLTLRWQVKVVRMPLCAGAFPLACLSIYLSHHTAPPHIGTAHLQCADHIRRAGSA
jgi:hypothetical protein